MGTDGVQQITGPVTVHAGDGDHLANAQAVKLIHFQRGFPDLVALVDGKDHRLAAAHEHSGNILVLGGHTGAQFAHHDDTVGRVNGDLGLFPHMHQQTVIGAGLNAAGVHQKKFMAAPLTVTENTVTGYAGGIFHDGQPLAGQFVKQRGLAHIGAAHNGYDGFCHGFRSSLS